MLKLDSSNMENVYYTPQEFTERDLFDDNIAESAITTIARMKPYYFVMRDSSLASDNVADNFDQLFNTYSKDTIRKII